MHGVEITPAEQTSEINPIQQRQLPDREKVGKLGTDPCTLHPPPHRLLLRVWKEYKICSCSKRVLKGQSNLIDFWVTLLIKFILKWNERPQEIQWFLFLKDSSTDSWSAKNFIHPISKILKFYKLGKFVCAFVSFKTNTKIGFFNQWGGFKFQEELIMISFYSRKCHTF